MKTKLGVGVLGCVLAGPILAAQSDYSNGGLFYIGAGVGESHYKDLSALAVEEDVNTKVSVSEAAIGGDLFIGFNLTHNIAIEALLSNYGDFRIREEFTNGATVYNTSITGEFLAYGGAVKLSLPVSSSTELYTRLGGMYWETDIDVVTKEYINGVFIDSVSDSTSTDGFAAYLTLGAEFRVQDALALYVEYKYLDSEFDEGGLSSEQPVDGAYAGVKYYFGGKRRANRASATGRTLTACDEKYKDVVGLICDKPE